MRAPLEPLTAEELQKIERYPSTSLHEISVTRTIKRLCVTIRALQAERDEKDEGTVDWDTCDCERCSESREFFSADDWG